MIVFNRGYTMKTSFKTIIKAFGNNTGIVVPEVNLLELKAGKKPPVKVNVNGYEYQSTIASMSGYYLIPLSKEHRLLSVLKGNDEVDVILTLESKDRNVDIPFELIQILNENNLLDLFEKQSYSNRKEMVRLVVDSKKEDTKIKRLNQIVNQLKDLKHE